MMKFFLEVQGEAGEIYQISFLSDDNGLAIACNCKAGAFSKLCRHKLAILTGDKALLNNIDQEEDFIVIQNCLSGTLAQTWSRELLEVKDRISRLEQEAIELKSALEHNIRQLRPNSKVWKN